MAAVACAAVRYHRSAAVLWKYAIVSFRPSSRRTVGCQPSLAALSKQQFKASTGAVTATASALVMAIGGIYVLQGSLTLGSLLVLLTYFAALYSPLETLAYLSDGFASASAGARRVLNILEADDAQETSRETAHRARVVPPSSRADDVDVGPEGRAQLGEILGPVLKVAIE